jgi:hypothetical protein
MSVSSVERPVSALRQRMLEVTARGTLLMTKRAADAPGNDLQPIEELDDCEVKSYQRYRGAQPGR